MRSFTVILGIFAVLAVVALIVLSRTPNIIALPGATSEYAATSTPATHTSSLPVLGPVIPPFQGITRWWNTPGNAPLTPDSLRGKVVLVDFWTYSCINCIRTLPFMRAMHEKYADKGLVIVGIHTPEFAFEAEPANVDREIRKNDLRYAVALDPDYITWNSYNNRYWPAGYFFDRQGRLRHTHFGEGDYGEIEEVIRELLAENGETMDERGHTTTTTALDFTKIKTPETYFGLKRGDAFAGEIGAAGVPKTYGHNKVLSQNQWDVFRSWVFQPEYVESREDKAEFRFNVQANKMHLVLESADGTDKTLEIYVDGKKTGEVIVNASTLYDIASFPDGEPHSVQIHLPSGVRFYAATFS